MELFIPLRNPYGDRYDKGRNQNCFRDLYKTLKINSNFDRLFIGAIYPLKIITAIITTLSFLE